MLSPIEKDVFLNGVANNPYNQGNPSKPVYIDSVEEFVEAADVRTLSVIINNLIREGLVSVTDDLVWLTNKGVRFYNQLCCE